MDFIHNFWKITFCFELIAQIFFFPQIQSTEGRDWMDKIEIEFKIR